MSQLEQRSHYRIHYPTLDRPVFKIAGRGFQIANVSESGVCITFRGEFSLGVGDTIRGTVHFRSGKTLRVVGEIIRKVEDKIIFKLSNSIPLPIIMEEQRFLIKKYKTLSTAN